MRNLEQQTPRSAERRLRDEPAARRLDTVTPRAARWLWPGRVALGQVTLVAGEPGAGTSLLLMNLASRVSRGRALPGSALPPAIPHDAAKAQSVVAKAEGAAIEPDLSRPDKEEPDDIGGGRPGKAVPHEAADVVLIMRQSMEDAVVPRLTALDADLKRIHDLGDVRDHNEDEEDGEDDEHDEKPTIRAFRADKDLEHLESLLARTPAVKLVVLDPMELWLDERGQRMSYSSRETIRQLGELARRCDVAIVAVARVPDKPGANDMRRWLDKLAGVEELAALFAVVRDRRRPCRRYLAALKNTLAEVEDALAFETPGGQVAWKRGGVSAAVVWATASRLDQEDAARWLRDELALGPKTAKELRAAADEAGIPWHVVYRARGIAGADCGRVGSGAGSYFVWSLFDRPDEVEESQESAKTSIENTETGEESGERGEVPDLDTEANAKCEMQNEKCELEEDASAEWAEQTEASGRGNGNSHESAKTSIENTKTGEASGEREELPDLDTEANAKCEMQNEKCELQEEASAEPTRFAGAPGQTEASGRGNGNSHESAKTSIENTKTGEESGEREELPDLDTEANAKCEMQNEKCELEEEASAEPTHLAGAPEQTEASGRGNGNSHESAKSSIENTKTGEEGGEREEVPDLDTEANAKCEMQNEKCELEEEASAEPTRFAGAPGQTKASGTEVEESQERANSSIENTKRGVARGARGPRSHPPRRRHTEVDGEAARAQNEFSDPTTDTERQEQSDAASAQPVEQPCMQKGEGSTPEHGGICIRYGESEPILIASMSSNLLWKMLTKEHYIPELKQEIERVLRERCDPRMEMRDQGSEGENRETW